MDWQVLCIAQQLFTGLHYIHHNEVMHRDMKSANILLDRSGNLQITDFGLARPFNSDARCVQSLTPPSPRSDKPMSDAESIQQTCMDVIQSLILAFSNRHSVDAGTRTNKFARGGIDPLRSCLARHIIQRQWTCGEQVVSLLSSLWGSQFCKATTRARFKAVISSSTSSSASCVALRQRRHGRREID